MQKKGFWIFLCKIAVNFCKVEKDIFSGKKNQKNEKKIVNNELMSITHS